MSHCAWFPFLYKDKEMGEEDGRRFLRKKMSEEIANDFTFSFWILLPYPLLSRS